VSGKLPNSGLLGCLFLSFPDFPREIVLQEQTGDSFIICESAVSGDLIVDA